VTLERFIKEASIGNMDKAYTYFSGTPSSLADFASILGSNSQSEFKRIKSIHIKGLSEAECYFELSQLQRTYFLSCSLSKKSGIWKVEHLPGISKQTAVLMSIEKQKNQQYIYRFLSKTGTLSFYSYDFLIQISEGIPYFITTWDNNILDAVLLEGYHSKRVLRIDSKTLEDMEKGNLKIAPDLFVYKKNKTAFESQDLSAIIPGMENITLYFHENEIVAAHLPQDINIQDLRILLKTNDFSSPFHNALTFSSEKDFYVSIQSSAEKYTVSPQDTLRLVPEGVGIQLSIGEKEIGTFNSRIFLSPSPDSKISVHEILRYASSEGTGTPYRGQMEIINHNGRLVLVNEVPTEQYLYSVVPSEMPVSFGLEALKVQAVAARAYALSAIFSTGFRYLGAHMDDSTASQVYNNVPEQDISTLAVDQTAGIIPVFQNSIIKAVFFSTSCGSTANHEDVWEDKDTHTFPGQSIPYLVHSMQGIKGSFRLDENSSFHQFITTCYDDAFDVGSPFFRWKVKWKKDELEACLRENLPRLQKQQRNFIFSIDENNHPIPSVIAPSKIGDILDVHVVKRGEGGNIMVLDVVCSTGRYRIMKELNIRNIFAPKQYLDGEKEIELLLHDGSIIKDFPLLPSAFVSFECVRDANGHLVELKAYGGGYGHGCGMSQYGVKGMVQKGFTYQQILKHYYPGIELSSFRKLTQGS